ncbi:MAG: BamA/OMP85 family outer membrane protein [Longimicrobiales bacterium]
MTTSLLPRRPSTQRAVNLVHRVASVAMLATIMGVFQPSVAKAQIGREEVESVEFVGNTAFTNDELSRAIRTKESTCSLVLRVTTCLFGLDWGKDFFYFSPRTVELDLLRLTELYRAHGFRNVAVDTVVTRLPESTVSVVFEITEGDPFVAASIEFEGDSIPDDVELPDELPLKVGDPLSFLLMEETLDTLTNRLTNSGYGRAEVFKRFRRPADSDEAAVFYSIDLGPATVYGPITVEENRLLDDEVVLGRLPFSEGQPYRARQIREAQRNLYQVGLVSRATVEADLSGPRTDSIIPVRVEVIEGDLHRVRAGGGLNSADCLNFEGRWSSRNFFGGGRTLQVRGGVSNLLAAPLQSTPLCNQAGTGEFGRTNWLAGIDFTQPTFFSPNVSFFAGVFGERQSLKNIFVRDALGLDAGVSRNLGGNSFLNLRMQPQLNRLSAADVILCATFSACEPGDIDVLQGANWLSPVAVSFTGDRTDRLFSPTSGFRALVDVEVADPVTGSDYAYVRAVADGSLYQSVDRKTVFAARVRAGIVNPGAFEELGLVAGEVQEIVPPQKRFYGGGANSIRGFAQSTLGPRSLSVAVGELLRRDTVTSQPICQPAEVRTLTCDGGPVPGNRFQERPIGGLATFEASMELRFDLADEGGFGGAAFVDVGQVWPEDFDFGDLEVTPGLGIRYNTLFGPLRLDVAYSFRNQEALQLVTSQIRPFVEGQDPDSDRIDIAGEGVETPEFIDWVISDDLALLEPLVLFGDEPGFSFRRFQIHFSIGQAF